MPECRICGTPAARRFEAFGYPWLKCACCKSIQKVLTESQFAALNPTYDPGHFLDSSSREQLESYLEIGEKTALIRRILELELAQRPNLRFLDVGSGMGAYMVAASRLGFEVSGFEPSADHARVARDVFKLHVINDYFTPGRIEDRFDLIMLSHVIEHVYDPQGFLNALASCLKPGGVLLVVTPNAGSMVASLCGGWWPMMKPIDHVSLISAESYLHIRFSTAVSLRHSWSGYPFEFASTLLTALRDRLRGATTAPVSGGKAGPLKSPSWRGTLLRMALTLASLPALLLPSNRRPCLVTLIRRGDKTEA